jgi:hypothetical protein
MVNRSFLMLCMLSVAACDGDNPDKPGGGGATDDGDGTADDGGGDDAELDEDGDGYTSAEDCDDSDGDVNPGATEICNGIDDDCDTDVDEDVTTMFYADTDGDTYGDAAATAVEDCAAPDGYVADDTDCNDLEGAVNPGATEVCNGIDDDCDTAVDEDVTTTFYADVDGDTFGDASATLEDCSMPSGYVVDATDCDDTDGSVNPSAVELCNGVDDDCDAATSEDGMVAFTDAAGATTDITATFSGDVSITTDGTYMVCDGTFSVNLDIDADVALVGVNDALQTTLDGGSAGTVVAVAEGHQVDIADLTMANG